MEPTVATLVAAPSVHGYDDNAVMGIDVGGHQHRIDQAGGNRHQIACRGKDLEVALDKPGDLLVPGEGEREGAVGIVADHVGGEGHDGRGYQRNVQLLLGAIAGRIGGDDDERLGAGCRRHDFVGHAAGIGDLELIFVSTAQGVGDAVVIGGDDVMHCDSRAQAHLDVRDINAGVTAVVGEDRRGVVIDDCHGELVHDRVHTV